MNLEKIEELKKIWQAIKEEFGDQAYKRVHDKGFVFSCNDEVEREFAGYGDVEIKPLQENQPTEK
jgi:hypothetical protein